MGRYICICFTIHHNRYEGNQSTLYFHNTCGIKNFSSTPNLLHKCLSVAVTTDLILISWNIFELTYNINIVSDIKTISKIRASFAQITPIAPVHFNTTVPTHNGVFDPCFRQLYSDHVYPNFVD